MSASVLEASRTSARAYMSRDAQAHVDADSLYTYWHARRLPHCMHAVSPRDIQTCTEVLRAGCIVRLVESATGRRGYILHTCMQHDKNGSLERMSMHVQKKT